MNNRIKLSVFILCISLICPIQGVTVDQMKKATGMLRQVCQSKLKLTDELVNSLTGKVFPEDRDLKCYTFCIMEMSNIMKKTKVNYEAALKQIDIMMPDELKEANKNALTICKDSSAGIKDTCEAGYAVTKCLYNNNPTFYFP